MKKLIAVVLIALTLFSLVGCSKIDEVIQKAEENKKADIILVPSDVLDPQKIYDQTIIIMQNLDSYVGKTVHAEGTAYYSPDSSTGYYLRISDQVCCQEDIEFSLPEGVEYPEDGSFFQLFAVLKSRKAGSGNDVMWFEGTKVIYEDELLEMYEQEESAEE